MFCNLEWGTVADWLVAAGTLILAAVAIAQDTIRAWFYRPTFKVSCSGLPPDCVSVPFTTLEGVFVTDSIYLRILVENEGNATAQTAEVYAKELRIQRLNKKWEVITSFPPMNLKWSNIGTMYTRIVPGMGKYCDVGHIVEPARRQAMNEDAPNLNLTNQQTSLAFDLIGAPNNKTHIVGPGEYQLDIQIAAENAHPIKKTLAISLRGTWDADPEKMLREGVGISVLPA
jgi:hypothetical protein